jgi:hypothetical protein
MLEPSHQFKRLSFAFFALPSLAFNYAEPDCLKTKKPQNSMASLLITGGPDGIDHVGPLFTRSSGSKRFMLRISVKIAYK